MADFVCAHPTIRQLSLDNFRESSTLLHIVTQNLALPLNRLLPILLALVLITLGGCAGIASRQAGERLSQALLDQDDPQLVREALPAYLVLVDAALSAVPDHPDLLISGAQLYGAYAGNFVSDPKRALRLTDKARSLAQRAICIDHGRLCQAEHGGHEDFLAALDGVDDTALLYAYGTTWLGWLQARSSDWGAVADIPRIEAVLQRVVRLDETVEHGRAHAYLGALACLRPPALGGHPEQGRWHFERALALSGGRDLLVKVEYARRCARLVYDRALHDRLLREVLVADPHVPRLTLSNVIAREQAETLLKSADDYFEDMP